MASQTKRVVPVKGQRRVRIVDSIVNFLANDLSAILKEINWKKATERRLAAWAYKDIRGHIADIFEEHFGFSKEAAKSKAHDNVVFEQIAKHTINNFSFLGVQHRPDMEIHFDDMSIGIEIKKGDNGAAVREGVGQSLAYASKYDFVIYMFIDTTSDGKIRRSRNNAREKFMLNSLWDNYNIRFAVIA